MRVNEPMTKKNFISSDFEKLDKCPWCNSREKKQWGKDEGFFNTVECDSCGLVYADSRLNPASQNKYYKNYFSEEHQAVPEAKVRDKMYWLEFEYIYNYIKTGKVLDIGCSGGEFLDYFNEHGFECYGIEVGSEAAGIARRKYGSRIINASLLDAEIKDTFDLIVLRGTIEHIPEARKVLIKAVNLLNKNKKSYIYITSTPNVDCISAKIFKTNWTQHLPEEHLFHFKKKHFDDLFAEYGLSCIAFNYFYEETPYANVEEDISKVAKAIEMKKQNKEINFKSPAFYGNMMTLVYGTREK